jgi:hypothetical protein
MVLSRFPVAQCRQRFTQQDMRHAVVRIQAESLLAGFNGLPRLTGLESAIRQGMKIGWGGKTGR